MNNNSKHSRTSREGIVLILQRGLFASVFIAGTDGEPEQAERAPSPAKTAVQRKDAQRLMKKMQKFYQKNDRS